MGQIAENHAQRTLQQLSREIRRDYKTLQNWRKVAAKWGINPGLAYRIAKDKYEPKGAALRCQLGLPALVLAAPCPIHGVVHTMKRCPRARQYRDLFDMPVKLLREMLEQRKEM